MFIRVLIVQLFIANFAFAECDKFLDERLEQMNIGSIKSPKCGASKSEEEGVIRISMSSVKGRKDLGPTLSLHPMDTDEVRVTQLLSKDPLTKATHKYLFSLNKNCTVLREVKYQIHGKQIDLSQASCDNQEKSFNDDYRVSFPIEKLCSKFFPMKASASETSESTSAAQE